MNVRLIDASSAADHDEEPDARIGSLARALTSFEAEFEADRPNGIVLADASDPALAAALVALKLQIPVQAKPAATGSATGNGRLIAVLADPYTPSA